MKLKTGQQNEILYEAMIYFFYKTSLLNLQTIKINTKFNKKLKT